MRGIVGAVTIHFGKKLLMEMRPQRIPGEITSGAEFLWSESERTKKEDP